jgi:hypothetical protein
VPNGFPLGRSSSCPWSVRSVSSSRPSNRACGSPAHGLPTFFTGGIQRFQARKGLGGTMIPSRLIRPRWFGDNRTWVIPHPRARRRLPRLDNHNASRVRA